MPEPSIRTRDLTRDDWGHLEGLFGDRGGCAGCWCMVWRLEAKEFRAGSGEPNRLALRELVRSGRLTGCLAFAEGGPPRPVGWCSVAPRSEFPRLERAPTLRTDWDEGTWSVSCFFIARGWRGKGVATQLVDAAVDLARRGGAKRVEGYPAAPYRSGDRMPGAFAWTGVPKLFERAGFDDVTPVGQKRPVYVKRVKRPG